MSVERERDGGQTAPTGAGWRPAKRLIPRGAVPLLPGYRVMLINSSGDLLLTPQIVFLHSLGRDGLQKTPKATLNSGSSDAKGACAVFSMHALLVGGAAISGHRVLSSHACRVSLFYIITP